LESKKKNVGNHAFSKKGVKMQKMYGNFFTNLSSVIFEKWMVIPNFLSGF